MTEALAALDLLLGWHHRRATPLIEGEHYRIVPGGCWPWLKGKDARGYGKTSVGSRTDGTKRLASAHRILWECVHGPVPDGLVLDHLCRNPSCVNPDHLELVTPAENVRRGSRATLTWETARAIRHDKRGLSTRRLGLEYGVSHFTIQKILNKVAWWPEPNDA